MAYTVNQLAKIAGVSVRTLHYYDEIGLLSPSSILRNGYRQYGDAELLRLQQILFFRELEFPLEEIKKVVTAPGFDMRVALIDQKRLIELKRERLSRLIKTIDATIKKINQEKTMADQDMFGSFSKEESEEYAREAKERWGHTDAYKQSQERVKKMTKDDWQRIKEEGGAIINGIIANMDKGADDEEVQKYIAQHYNSLRHFYEPNLVMYRGLGDMYAADPRFAKFYDQFKPGLAQFMREAINVFCDINGKQ